MRQVKIELKTEVSRSFMAQRAAQSLDIDTNKKSIHRFECAIDIDSDFNVGLIVGSSGSGKTTLAKELFGDDCFEERLDLNKAVIDQFPESFDYDLRASMLIGIGLSQVPCWVKPAHTLSNGQRARAEAALQMAFMRENIVCLDEWTSLVDRTVAKAMSFCLAKFARKQNKKIILLSCHADVFEWLNPDWVIDCNIQKFIDRRLLQKGKRERKEKLKFTIQEVDRSTWKNFSKYHYLSENLPGGRLYLFGLFHEKNQIGFQCFANYVVRSPLILHFNRTVIHPDYVGLGLGMKLIDATSKIVRARGYRIMGKFSSEPVFKAMMRNANWKLLKIDRHIGDHNTKLSRNDKLRSNVKTYSFEFIGGGK